MAEELPPGDFLLILKITTMLEQIYIVTRQDCFVERGHRYALPSDNLVVGAWVSKDMVDYFFVRRIASYIEHGFTVDHVKEPNSTGVVDRYITKDRDGEIYCTYSVVLELLI